VFFIVGFRLLELYCWPCRQKPWLLFKRTVWYVLFEQ